MEEAEELLLLSLREAGCTLGEDIKSLGDIQSGDLIALTGKCLNMIRASHDHGDQGGDNAAYPEENTSMDSVKKFRVCQVSKGRVWLWAGLGRKRFQRPRSFLCCWCGFPSLYALIEPGL